MEGQLSLFGEEQENSNAIPIIGNPENSEELLKCYETELKEVKFMGLSDLFSGFNTIKAITFSYDVGFINQIMEQFEYGEIILGADFLVEKDQNLQEVLVNSYEAGECIRKNKRLSQMVETGDLEFRTPSFILDHRKIFLLKSDDGRTRVVTSSANMTRRAWNGEHMEFYEFDDTEFCYDEYLQDFETAWTNSNVIPFSVIASRNSDDKVEGNALLKKVKEVGEAIVLQDSSEVLDVERTKYVIDHKKLREEYGMLIDGVAKKGKGGYIQIDPASIKKIEHNRRRFEQKTVKSKEKTENYPTLTFDYGEKKAFLNGVEMNLNPSEEEVRSDIELLFQLFRNFNDFIDPGEKLKPAHFKMMNALFVSPFHARIRCTAFLKDISTSSIPMFLLVASSMANCGKTFSIRAALKMMTGKDLPVLNKEICKKDDIRACQVGCKGVPVFIDELDNRYMATITDIIKNPEKCEQNQLEEQPMLVFASNDVVEPDDKIRKRMVFIRLKGALPSSIDQSAYKGMGNALIKKLGTAFYSEYLRRMLDEVSKEIDYMIFEKNRPDTYYPDLMKISSSVLIGIIEDYGYQVPEYMKVLTWNEDYSIDSKSVSDNAIEEIESMYYQNKKAFRFTKTLIIIEMGNDKSSKKKVESWANTLPPEMKAEFTTTKDCSKITLDRKEYEKRLGYKLNSFFSYFRGAGT